MQRQRTLNLEVERDHIASLTKANGVNALSELIWNALDADAQNIWVSGQKNGLGVYDRLVIEDDGHGLSYEKAVEVFSRIGGSDKRINAHSPGNRVYHGKEGKGRYKALALGEAVTFRSCYQLGQEDSLQEFEVLLSRNQLSNPIVMEPEKSQRKTTGFSATIFNTNERHIAQALSREGVNELRERLAVYNLSYPNFSLFIGGERLDFASLIINQYYEDFDYSLSEDENILFNIRIIEWSIECQKKLYFCGRHGVAYSETGIGIRTPLNLSLSIESPYIDRLHADNKLDIGALDPVLSDVIAHAKQTARKYSRTRLHLRSKDFINELKREHLYPYQTAPNDEVEIATRQVFDIVAVQVNEFLPSFQNQDNQGKKFVLALVKEALENDSDGLKKILNEVIGLPRKKQEELAEILETSSLSSIIDTMREITDRLQFLRGLQHLIYDSELSKNILERKHLHKIIVNETWVFGDDYTYGADDVSLKNVLKAHLQYLGRQDFEEVIASEDNSELGKIPDVCLWRQFNQGKHGYFQNLIVELKKPTVDAGIKEYMQITDYAARISKDSRFTKEHHKWTFILLVRDINEECERFCTHSDREYGHVISNDNYDVYIKKWSDVIDRAKTRYEYIKNKLNITLTNNEECIGMLRDKYRQYLPDEFPENVE
jgi:hypothetical protein